MYEFNKALTLSNDKENLFNYVGKVEKYMIRNVGLKVI